MRQLRSLLRHRAFRRKISTAIKNRTWSEFRKRDIGFEANLATKIGRRKALASGVYEVYQNVEVLDVVENQIKQIEAGLEKRYGDLKVVRLLQSIPGIGFITALSMYAEICDIKRFSNPEKLAHYAGLVPRLRQSGERATLGRETRANRWLKPLFIEAAWSHVNWFPNGTLAKVFDSAYERKRDKRKAIKIVARKLVNIVWAVWTYEEEFKMMPDKARGKTPT